MCTVRRGVLSSNVYTAGVYWSGSAVSGRPLSAMAPTSASEFVAIDGDGPIGVFHGDEASNGRTAEEAPGGEAPGPGPQAPSFAVGGGGGGVGVVPVPVPVPSPLPVPPPVVV